MRKSIVIAIVAAFATSTSAFASGWGTQTTITGLYIDSAAGIAFLKTANNQNIDSCAASNYLSISTLDAHFKELYATALAAQLAGATVSLKYNGCLNGYPRVISVAVPSIW